MGSIAFSTSMSGGGQSISGQITRTPDGVNTNGPIILPVGQPGTLADSDANTGTVTMTNSGHGITTGMKVDVYWAGGRRYGMTVGSVSGTSVPVDLGAGTNFPGGSTAVVVTPQVVVDVTIPGTTLSIIGAEIKYANPNSVAAGHADFQDVTPTSITTVDLPANDPWIVDVAGGMANPFSTSTALTMRVTNGSATEVGTLILIYGFDSTP